MKETEVPDLCAVARLEERRHAEGVAELAREARPLAGGVLGHGGEGSWLDVAAGMGLEGEVGDGELDEVVRFYAERGVEPSIEVASLAHPTLIEGLGRRGFVLAALEHVFARALAPGEDLSAPRAVAGLAVERVVAEDETAVAAFVDVSTSGFRPDGEPVPPPLVEACKRTIASARCEAWLARVGGEPVGGGALYLGEGIASLGGTSVLPAFRRRGIQQALIARRLGRARERGARFATIHARPGISTERNALRLGFSLAYAKAVLARPGVPPA